MIVKLVTRLWKSLYATTVQVVDPWRDSGGTYVSQFRRHLDDVAVALSDITTEPVSTRFNPEEKCAEFYAGDNVLVEVRVHGSECSPYETIVTLALTHLSLTAGTLDLFERAGLPSVKFAVAST